MLFKLKYLFSKLFFNLNWLNQQNKLFHASITSKICFILLWFSLSEKKNCLSWFFITNKNFYSFFSQLFNFVVLEKKKKIEEFCKNQLILKTFFLLFLWFKIKIILVVFNFSDFMRNPLNKFLAIFISSILFTWYNIPYFIFIHFQIFFPLFN